MIIIKMLKRITGYNQEELADFLDVSRASINLWDNSEGEMTTYEKNIISSKLDIPFEYFDKDLKDDFEKCKKLYQLIQNRVKTLPLNDEIEIQNNLSSKPDDNFVNQIENKLSYEDSNESELSDYDIINALSKGYNPYTGEVFEKSHILNDEKVQRLLVHIKNKYYKYDKENLSKEDLTLLDSKLFGKLRRWRYDKMLEEGFFSAYMVFTDKELINIITAQIDSKEDLLNVKGIGDVKYQKYGDELFDIISKHKERYGLNNNLNNNLNNIDPLVKKEENNNLNNIDSLVKKDENNNLYKLKLNKLSIKKRREYIKTGKTFELQNTENNKIEKFKIIKPYYETKPTSIYHNPFTSVGINYKKKLVLDYDTDKGEISVKSDFAKKVLGHRVGDVINLLDENGNNIDYLVTSIN